MPDSFPPGPTGSTPNPVGDSSRPTPAGAPLSPAGPSVEEPGEEPGTLRPQAPPSAQVPSEVQHELLELWRGKSLEQLIGRNTTKRLDKFLRPVGCDVQQRVARRYDF